MASCSQHYDSLLAVVTAQVAAAAAADIAAISALGLLLLLLLVLLRDGVDFWSFCGQLVMLYSGRDSARRQRLGRHEHKVGESTYSMNGLDHRRAM